MSAKHQLEVGASASAEKEELSAIGDQLSALGPMADRWRRNRHLLPGIISSAVLLLELKADS
jgi:hypothetical protein